LQPIAILKLTVRSKRLDTFFRVAVFCNIFSIVAMACMRA